jgi:hypothetical protein
MTPFLTGIVLGILWKLSRRVKVRVVLLKQPGRVYSTRRILKDLAK